MSLFFLIVFAWLCEVNPTYGVVALVVKSMRMNEYCGMVVESQVTCVILVRANPRSRQGENPRSQSQACCNMNLAYDILALSV